MVHKKGYLFLFLALLSWFFAVRSQTSTFNWIFQQPTYLLEKDAPNITTYTCDSNQESCKVNFDFSGNIPDEEPSTHYACTLNFGFGVTGEENKCNPNTVEFPVGTWQVNFTLKKIADESTIVSGNITILHPDGSIDPLRVTHAREWQSPSYLLEKEDSSLSQYRCDPEEEECKINLLVSPKLDGAHSSLLACDISADFEIIPGSDPCNPNTSIVPSGEHILTIKILDKSKNTILQTATVNIKNTPKDETIDPTRVVTEITFQQPTYLVEKEDTSRETYACDSGQDECKINLLVIPKLDGVESSLLSCHITSDFGWEEHDCNPNTFTLPSGKHTLTITTKNTKTGDIISTRTLTINGLASTGSGGSFVVQKLDFSQSKIVVQSGLDESFVCKTDTCQVNFSAEVPEGTQCQWDFGTGIFETQATDEKCNPGYVKFPENTDVILILHDPNYPENSITKIVRVSRSKEEKTSLLVPRITLQTKITSSKKITSTGIICEITGDTCSLNFTAAESVGATLWYWDFGDGITSEKENPASHKFPPGTYLVQLTVGNDKERLTTTYTVEVQQEKKPEPCPTCALAYKNMLIINAVLPNPPHADTVEWIEIKNISSEILSLDDCRIQDDTREYTLGGTLISGGVLRLRQALTGINLGNTKDTLVLCCYEIEIDTLSWDFPIPNGYILRREVMRGVPQKTLITQVIDGDTVEAIVDGKKTKIRMLGIDTPETVHPRKAVQEFGLEASNFTKEALLQKEVWLTFDAVPVDHYGRRLAYIWVCSGDFSPTCELFNKTVIARGYGRMERRFSFIRYEEFDATEKEAKNNKYGLWGNADIVREISSLSQEEKALLSYEQEKEFLLLQEALLLECEIQEELCEKKNINWQEVTDSLTTFHLMQESSRVVKISGRTWDNFPLILSIVGSGIEEEILTYTTDADGRYEISWIPQIPGEYVFHLFLRTEEGEVIREEKITIDTVSSHFSEPLSANILFQGKMTDNRRYSNGTFFCQSRGECSINVAGDSNRDDFIDYLWIFPDGTISDEKNPKAFDLGYGQYTLILLATDGITGEVTLDTASVIHTALPKKSSSASKNYTLDLKDIPQDTGGGVLVSGKGGANVLLRQGVLVSLIFLLVSVFVWRRG